MNEWEWNLLEDKAAIDHLEIGGETVRTGSRVRLLPEPGGDILDIALSGQVATIESIEEDYEGVQHICVVLDEDPGRDLGMMRQPGHRFFFTPAEVEPLPEQEGDARASQKITAVKPQILVTGIGNIFLGDDAFGVEVVRRLQVRGLPNAVRAVAFGIRGLDLAYALQDGYETTIFVDAYPRGKDPGTVSVVEPDLNELEHQAEDFLQPHAMTPMNVLRIARTMNGGAKRILLEGCEPLNLGGEEGVMGLSPVVAAAVDVAAEKIVSLVHELLNDELR